MGNSNRSTSKRGNSTGAVPMSNDNTIVIQGTPMGPDKNHPKISSVTPARPNGNDASTSSNKGIDAIWKRISNNVSDPSSASEKVRKESGKNTVKNQNDEDFDGQSISCEVEQHEGGDGTGTSKDEELLSSDIAKKLWEANTPQEILLIVIKNHLKNLLPHGFVVNMPGPNDSFGKWRKICNEKFPIKSVKELKILDEEFPAGEAKKRLALHRVLKFITRLESENHFEVDEEEFDDGDSCSEDYSIQDFSAFRHRLNYLNETVDRRTKSIETLNQNLKELEAQVDMDKKILEDKQINGGSGSYVGFNVYVRRYYNILKELQKEEKEVKELEQLKEPALHIRKAWEMSMALFAAFKYERGYLPRKWLENRCVSHKKSCKYTSHSDGNTFADLERMSKHVWKISDILCINEERKYAEPILRRRLSHKAHFLPELMILLICIGTLIVILLNSLMKYISTQRCLVIGRSFKVSIVTLE